MSGFRPRFFLDREHLRLPQDGECAPGSEVTLDAEDSHHALRVLRLRAGDGCEVVISGVAYSATVGQARHPLQVIVGPRLEGEAAGAAYRLSVGLVQALTRPGLVGQVLEKGTEVGASFFIMVTAANSPRLHEGSGAGRAARWGRIALEAAKQSKQVAVPWVETAASLDQALGLLRAQGIRSLVLDPGAAVALRDKLARGPGGEGAEGATSTDGLAIWVGPESGWSSAEREWFTTAGLDSVRLGRSVLRTETAGPVAVAAARLLLQDW